jgi:hypothetical protein
MILVQTSIFVKPTASSVGTRKNPLAKGTTSQNPAKGKAMKSHPASALGQSKLKFG